MRPLIYFGAALAACAPLAACTGVLGGADPQGDTAGPNGLDGGDGDGDAPTDRDLQGPTPTSTEELQESCNEEKVLLAAQLRRLSEEQIRNSIEDTFGEIFDPSFFPQMDDGARLIGMNLLADKLNINNVNFEQLYGSSRQIADRVLEQDAAFSACAQDTAPECVNELATSTMHRLWRGLESAEDLSDLSSHLTEFDSNEQKLRFVLNSLMLGSKFLFRSEMGAAEGADQALSNHEIASFLSYAMWNSTPDEALLAAADQAEPLSDEQIGAQVTRMLDDPRVDAGFVALYKDYLKLDLVMSREKAEEFGFDESVRRDLLASAEQMLESHIQAGTDFMDVFGSGDIPVNQNIASFFGTTSESAELTPASFDNRYGILTHPAFLAVHSTLGDSGIVKRGVFTLEQLLCVEMEDPPPNVTSLEPPPELDPATTSERDLLTATHSSQVGCQGCHQFIDPAGFGFENYDAVGRYREVEKGSVPIDASGELDGVGSYDDGVTYAASLITSEPMHECVTKRFLEHYFGQELEEDSCVTDYFKQRLSETDGSVRSLLVALSEIQIFIRSRHL